MSDFIKNRKGGSSKRSSSKSSKKVAKKSSSKKRKARKSSPLDTSVVDKVDKKQQAKWRAEEDLRTLQSAKEIERDRSRLNNARAIAREQMNALKDVAE